MHCVLLIFDVPPILGTTACYKTNEAFPLINRYLTLLKLNQCSVLLPDVTLVPPEALALLE